MVQSLKAELAGMSAEQIRELIETSVHATSARDPEMLAAFLAGDGGAPSEGGE